MSAIVEDLLLLSRIDAHQEQLHFARLDLAVLVRGSSEKLRTIAERRGVTLAVTAPGRAAVVGDAAHLERALLNVVKNAIEHSPSDGVVTIAMEPKGRRVEVSVSDQGEGIPAEDLKYVFDRFYRSDAARARNRGGSGLGLSIAQWIARRHHSAISPSAPGQGTTMTISLPLAS